jgi:hypothetical protein
MPRTPEQEARAKIDAQLADCGWIVQHRHAMSSQLQKIIESKRALRRELAALTISEKLRLLDLLRERDTSRAVQGSHSNPVTESRGTTGDALARISHTLSSRGRGVWLGCEARDVRPTKA